jgi:hypothetical protein
LGLQEVYSLYMDSIHGSHDILSSKNPKSKTNHANVPQTCGTCHAGPLRDYSSSIHGQMLQGAPEQSPVCTNCHTAHQIARVGTAEWQMKTTATCGGCHKDEYATYRDTFHAQVPALGYQQTARCWDCHRHHDILPPSDPKSTVAPAQLISTCGKPCRGECEFRQVRSACGFPRQGALPGAPLFGRVHEFVVGKRPGILRAAHAAVVHSIALRRRETKPREPPPE